MRIAVHSILHCLLNWTFSGHTKTSHTSIASELASKYNPNKSQRCGLYRFGCFHWCQPACGLVRHPCTEMDILLWAAANRVLAMLIAMLVTWVKDGRPHYASMDDGQTIAYVFFSTPFASPLCANRIVIGTFQMSERKG